MGTRCGPGKMPRMLWLATTLKLLAEVALMAWVGRWLLELLMGPQRREANFAWRVLDAVVRPPVALAGLLLRSPRAAQALAVAAVLALWLAATAWKVQIVRACVAAGVATCG
jgi:hypothetical protein